MSVRRFYGQWAGVYDRLARRTPGIGRLRRTAVVAATLSPGETAVEIGCGTGANLGVLADAVGPTGRAIGLDITGPVLSRASRYIGSHPAVSVIQADATQPPIAGPIDAVLGTFVAGLFADPVAVFKQWWDRLAEGGRLVVMSFQAPDTSIGHLLWPVYKLLPALSRPPLFQLRYPDSPAATHDRRVARLHDWVADQHNVIDRRLWGGFVRLTVATRRS